MVEAAISIVDTANALSVRLPANYEAAKQALIRCEQVDECFEWANKTAAIEVYARQSKDDTLVIIAQRIQARAIRRCGELLKSMPAGHWTRATPTRTSAAAAAGMSRTQQRQAAQIAQIPNKKFERLVESAKPPKVYRLAQIGVQKRDTRTEKSLLRSLVNAEEMVRRRTLKLEAAVALVDQLKQRLSAFEGKKE